MRILSIIEKTDPAVMNLLHYDIQVHIKARVPVELWLVAILSSFILCGIKMNWQTGLELSLLISALVRRGTYDRGTTAWGNIQQIQ